MKEKHIDEHWATHPRSVLHLKFIFEAAKKDRRFQLCVDRMVSQGVCTADGRLLLAYRNGAFNKL
jgi:hypothetical protein